MFVICPKCNQSLSTQLQEKDVLGRRTKCQFCDVVFRVTMSDMLVEKEASHSTDEELVISHNERWVTEGLGTLPASKVVVNGSVTGSVIGCVVGVLLANWLFYPVSEAICGGTGEYSSWGLLGDIGELVMSMGELAEGIDEGGDVCGCLSCCQAFTFITMFVLAIPLIFGGAFGAGIGGGITDAS